MQRIYNRVSDWNQARYERVYTHKLATDMLAEEFNEWFTATTAVDKLDALCDIVYVAFGNIWKLNPSHNRNEEANQLSTDVANFVLDICEEPAYFIATHICALRTDNNDELLSQHIIVKLATAQIMGMGLRYDQMIDALLVVCDANDTKEVKQMDSKTKAGKGSSFVAPEPKLAEILRHVEN